MKIERRKIADLYTDPANARVHGPKNMETIKASLRRFGQQHPLVVNEDGMVVAGNGRLVAMGDLGWKECDVVVTDLTGLDLAAFGVADNRTAELAEWDRDALTVVLDALKADDDLAPEDAGFDAETMAETLAALQPEPEPDEPKEVVEDEAPEPEAEAVTQTGDLWLLGDHRVLCGDSTDRASWERVTGGEVATLVHADPPYGMGKEAEGVANDNLYGEKLDAFQMAWWGAARPSLADNGSAYIWGNAEPLWRLWLVGGLRDSERLTMRNEVVWEKPSAMGSASEATRSYPVGTERCLFFMLGEQGFNTNTDNYWEGWDPILNALRADCDAMGWGPADIKRICGVGMYGHWFTRSQWVFIPEEHYKKLQEAAREHDAFKREHDELKREHDELKREHDELKRDFYATRAHFDNAHEAMTDVWHFPRVHGEERHGHATPKPVELVARAMKSSSREGDAVLVPFGGTGPEWIAAEQLGRRCFGLELEPRYVDVIVRRWQKLTGKQATLDGDGRTFDEVQEERA